MSTLIDRLPKKHKFQFDIGIDVFVVGARAVYRKFALCRCCFRELALRGDIPGVVKSSW